MTRVKRKILFYLFLLLFIAAGPFILFYSFGYKIDFFSGEITPAGGIFVKSQTSRISVLLDGEFKKETSLLTGGALLTEVQPGAHTLQIRKSAHRAWEKIITVEPLAVLEFRSVLLIPEEIKTSTSTPEETVLIEATSTAETSLELDPQDKLLKTDNSTTTVLLSNVNSFTSVGNTVLAIDKQGFLSEINQTTGEIKIVGRPGFYLSKKPAEFAVSPRRETAIIDSSGGLFLASDEKVIPLEGGVQKASFSSRGRKLLIFKDNELKVRWMEDARYQPFEKKDTTETILASDRPILEADWLYGEDQHLVFRTSAGIFVTELDGRGGRNTYDLVREEAGALRTSPDIPNSVFFKKDGAWYKIEL